MKFYRYADSQGRSSEIVEHRAAILDAIGTMQQILCSVSIFLCNTDYLPVRGVELQNTQKPIFWKPLIGARLQAILEKALHLVRSTCLDFW
jgi:hypothetical protein